MTEEKEKTVLDLRGIPCPQNVSRLLIHLAGLENDTLLEVVLDGGEPFDNVMDSLVVEQITVIDITTISETQKKITLIVK